MIHAKSVSSLRRKSALELSEERLELATSAANIGIWDWDLQTNTFVYSERARQISGLPSEGEITYDMVRAATHPEDLPRTSAQSKRATDPAIKSTDSYEYRILLPDGTVRWVLAHGLAQFEGEGVVERAVRYVGTLQDITLQKVLDKEHLELAQRLKLALDASRMAVWEVDVLSDTLVGSPDLNRLFGLPPDAQPDLNELRGFYFPGEQQRLGEIGRGVLEAGERYIEADYRIIRSDGEVRWLSLRCEILKSGDGQPVRVVGVLSDVSTRKAAELRTSVLAELTSRIRDLEQPDDISYVAAEILGKALGVSRAGYGTIDKAAETITIARDWNAPGIKSLSGVLQFRDYGSYIEDLKGGNTVVFADAYKDARTASTADALKAISAQAVVNMPVTEQGGFVALLFLNHEQPRVWSADELSLIREIADHTRTAVERRRVEADLRVLTEQLEQRISDALAERALLAEIVESTDAFVQVVDLDFRWLAINRAAIDEFERIFGVRPAAGMNMLELLNHIPKQRQAVKEAWKRALDGDPYTDVREFGELDKGFYEAKYNILRDENGNRIGAFQFVYDVTERIESQRRLARTEEALRQSQKMESIGQLTGGVAHDFNNLLTPIIGGLDMLRRRIGMDERTHKILNGALTSAERAQTLVQRLLAFARRQPLQPTPIDIATLVEGLTGLIASTGGPAVNLRLEIEDGPLLAMADANQVEMALLNLAVNARDAMPDGGQLTIRASMIEVIDRSAENLSPGRYVKVLVEDTGTGMDETTRLSAIEPFFSTKGIGRGTGLGLSMVHGLAAQLGGDLRIDSVLGEGTTVSLLLPATDVRPNLIEQAPIASTKPTLGTVLLVDDEELVRASTAEMLGEIGYVVAQACSAEDAIKQVENGLSADVVVTDHLMPGLTGLDLARILRRERPTLPILIVSGYAHIDGISSDVPRLTKPFRESDLSRSLAALTGSIA